MIMYKISYKDIQHKKYSQYFTITISGVYRESLYCRPVTYIILYANYVLSELCLNFKKSYFFYHLCLSVHTGM